MRRAGTIIAILVVIIIVVVGVFLATIDINRYRSTVQAELAKRLGRNLTLGEMHLSVLPFRFVVRDVRYSGSDMNHELASLAGILGLHQQNQGFTNINKMTGEIAIKNGIAQTNNTEALLDLGNVGIAGTANLIDQALNLRVTAVVSTELSQKAGGANIGGYLKTALANSQGQLVIPAIVTGTFQHPRFEPDLQQVAQMKLKGFIPDFNLKFRKTFFHPHVLRDFRAILHVYVGMWLAKESTTCRHFCGTSV